MKIIQIAVAGETDNFAGDLFALGDDGSLWRAVLVGSQPIEWAPVTPPRALSSDEAETLRLATYYRERGVELPGNIRRELETKGLIPHLIPVRDSGAEKPLKSTA